MAKILREAANEKPPRTALRHSPYYFWRAGFDIRRNPVDQSMEEIMAMEVLTYLKSHTHALEFAICYLFFTKFKP
jgi:hypothetical protein